MLFGTSTVSFVYLLSPMDAIDGDADVPATDSGSTVIWVQH
jgi:hypothetical protein